MCRQVYTVTRKLTWNHIQFQAAKLLVPSYKLSWNNNEKNKTFKETKMDGESISKMLIHSPARSSCKCIPRALPVTTVKHACRDTKVSELYYPISVQQYIPSLEWHQMSEQAQTSPLEESASGGNISYNQYLNISMNVPMWMEIFQSLESFFQDRTNNSLLKSIWIWYLHEVQTRTFSHEGHYHPKVVINNEWTKCFY